MLQVTQTTKRMFLDLADLALFVYWRAWSVWILFYNVIHNLQCALAKRTNNSFSCSPSFVIVLHDGFRSVGVVGLRDGGETGPCADWFLTHDISHSSSFNVSFPTPFNSPVDKHAAIGEPVVPVIWTTAPSAVMAQQTQQTVMPSNMLPPGEAELAHANSYYPQEPADLTGGLPINLDSLRDGPPGSKPFYPYSTLIRYVWILICPYFDGFQLIAIPDMRSKGHPTKSYF